MSVTIVNYRNPYYLEKFKLAIRDRVWTQVMENIFNFF